MNIGVTGTICSGKSSVIHLMGKLLSADILDSDKICRELLEKGAKGWQGLIRQWGELFLTESREVNRPRLRQAIFDDNQVRKELEQILHPLVRRRILEVAKEKSMCKEDLLVEVPLLFEVGWQNDFDWTVLVYASEKVCLERVMARDGVSREDGQKILNAQMNIDKKVQLADSVLDNSGSWVKTVSHVHQLLNVIKNGGTL